MLEARDLPKNDLSDFLEKDLQRVLEADRLARAKQQGVSPSQVCLNAYILLAAAYMACMSTCCSLCLFSSNGANISCLPRYWSAMRAVHATG